MVIKKIKYIDEVIDLSKPILRDKMTKVTPKKNHVLIDGRKTWSLETGVEIEIPEKFCTSLETEKII